MAVWRARLKARLNRTGIGPDKMHLKDKRTGKNLLGPDEVYMLCFEFNFESTL